MKITCCSIDALKGFAWEQYCPSKRATLISFVDPDLEHPPTPFWTANHLRLSFHDIDEDIPGFQAPSREDAAAILGHFQRTQESLVELVCCCTAGVGRSLAAGAALGNLIGRKTQDIFRLGTYNRLLYRLILEAAGKNVPAEPLVSLVVRVKYPIDRILAFQQCLRRQRWKNWELVAVLDGPDDNRCLPNKLDRTTILWTDEKRGHWGHPHRQRGIDAARGDYIGLSNDDNYYVPGYIDQMVYALESEEADLVLCDYLGHYLGWQALQTAPVNGQCDLGCWIARAELVKSTPWEGTDFDSDGKYIERLAAKAKKVAHVDRPLFVHN